MHFPAEYQPVLGCAWELFWLLWLLLICFGWLADVPHLQLVRSRYALIGGFLVPCVVVHGSHPHQFSMRTARTFCGLPLIVRGCTQRRGSLAIIVRYVNSDFPSPYRVKTAHCMSIELVEVSRMRKLADHREVHRIAVIPTYPEVTLKCSPA